MQRKTKSGQHRAAVGRQVAEAHTLGITGVPTCIFNDKYAVVGVQP